MKITFADGTKTVSVNAIPGTVNKEAKGEDVSDTHNEARSPIIRSGISKNGVCIVEVDDQGTYTQSLATLVGLRSSVGKGAYTVSMDDVAYSHEALVDVEMLGSTAQLVRLTWKGTISG